MMFSNELMLKCFPDKEAILTNLDEAILLAEKNHQEPNTRLLTACKQLLTSSGWTPYEQRRYGSQAAKSAGYILMAQAIDYHLTRQENGVE